MLFIRFTKDYPELRNRAADRPSLPMVILILRDFLTHTIEEKSDVEKHTISDIGTVGHTSAIACSSSFIHSSIANPFGLRTNLQFTLFEEGQKVIMIFLYFG